MPHLAFETFISQGFWLVVSFAVLYVLAAKFFVPNVAKIVESRAERISSDIATAEKAAAETVKAKKKHQDLLDKATAEARATLDAAMKKTEENIAVKRKELQANIEKSLVKAEKEIAKIEAESASIVSKVSDDIAKLMADKVAA